MTNEPSELSKNSNVEKMWKLAIAIICVTFTIDTIFSTFSPLKEFWGSLNFTSTKCWIVVNEL